MIFKFLDAELLRLELLHSSTIPKMDESEQHGGAVSTRSMKREREEQESLSQYDKETKVKGEKRKADDSDMSGLLYDGMDQLEMQENPLFRADLVFMPYKRQGLKGAVKIEQFTVT